MKGIGTLGLLVALILTIAEIAWWFLVFYVVFHFVSKWW